MEWASAQLSQTDTWKNANEEMGKCCDALISINIKNERAGKVRYCKNKTIRRIIELKDIHQRSTKQKKTTNGEMKSNIIEMVVSQNTHKA